jgi:tetratricopeptide (TPR) repeat protein
MSPSGAKAKPRIRPAAARPAPEPLLETSASRPRSPAFFGLTAVAMTVPIAVLADAVGPSDDPKAWALALLVAATGVAWAARWRGPGSAPQGGDRPARALRWTVVALLGWTAVTTCFSIAPGQSLLGAFGRGMGLIPVVAALAIFFLAQAECRTREAVRGIVDAALLGSGPVCLLALGQAMGWDPFPGAWDPAVADLRVRSTFGQHLFLGSYLVLLIPLAVGRLYSAVVRDRAPGEATGPTLGAVAAGAAWTLGIVGVVAAASAWSPAWWLLVPWGIAGAVAVAAAPRWLARRAGWRAEVALLVTLLTAQLSVVVLSRARGAFVAMIVGLSASAFAILIRRRAIKTLAAAGAALAAMIALVALLNVAGSPLALLRDVGIFSRLSRLTDVRYGNPVWFRLKVWTGITSGWGQQLAGREVIPDRGPALRAAIGYGPDTQLLALDRLLRGQIGVLRAPGDGWQGQYLVDRAHNALFDQLLTGGIVGAGLWLASALLALGIGAYRVATISLGEEMGLRAGLLGAAAAHLADGQVGIVTPASLALFWLVAGLLAAPPWVDGSRREPSAARASPPRRGWRAGALAAAALAAMLVAWLESSWLLASVAYAAGVRAHIAGRTAEAYADFQRSRELAPWLSLPAEAVGYTALRLAALESTAGSRLAILREAELALADARRRVPASAASWALSAQVAFAEARAGDRGKLSASLAAFERASRLRPQDPALLAQWGWALLDDGNPGAARKVAERAVAMSSRRPEWLAWAVLARSARELGDAAGAERAARSARRFAPPEAQAFLAEFLS